jgi:hypothetical protein
MCLSQVRTRVWQKVFLKRHVYPQTHQTSVKYDILIRRSLKTWISIL